MAETIASIPVDCPPPTRTQPQRLCLDKGYDYPEACSTGIASGFTLHLRSRGEEKKELKRKLSGHARLDESNPPDPCALGDSRGHVLRHAPLGLWHRCPASLGPTEIGSRPVRATLQKTGLPMLQTSSIRFQIQSFLGVTRENADAVVLDDYFRVWSVSLHELFERFNCWISRFRTETASVINNNYVTKIRRSKYM